MLLQHLAKGSSEDSHAAAVNYADARQAREEGSVHKLFDLARGLIDGLAYDVNFARDVPAFAFQLHRNTSGTRRFHRCF